MRFFVYLLIFSLPLFGCSSNRQVVKAERKAERAERKLDKEALKAYEEGLDRHLSIQTPETLDRMKKNRKKSNRWIRPKQRDPFYKRWFKKRR